MCSPACSHVQCRIPKYRRIYSQSTAIRSNKQQLESSKYSIILHNVSSAHACELSSPESWRIIILLTHVSWLVCERDHKELLLGGRQIGPSPDIKRDSTRGGMTARSNAGDPCDRHLTSTSRSFQPRRCRQCSSSWTAHPQLSILLT